jgi:hypothetical protein
VALYRNDVIENCCGTYTPQGTLSQETKFSLSEITFTDSPRAHQWAVIRTALCGLHTLPNHSSSTNTNSIIPHIILTMSNSVALSPQANYTD